MEKLILEKFESSIEKYNIGDLASIKNSKDL